MTNISILTAFERMWQHVVTALGKKSDLDHKHDEYLTNIDIVNKADKATTLAGYGITDAASLSYVDELIDGLTAEGTADAAVVQAALTAHTNNKNNPHGVTAAQIDAYNKAEVDTKLSGKSNTSHKHTVSHITDLTATATELNYVDGVTSNIQTQINNLNNSLNTKITKGDSGNLKLLTFYNDQSNGYGQVYKNNSATADYGTILEDKDSDGNEIGIVLRANGQVAALVKNGTYDSIATQTQLDTINNNLSNTTATANAAYTSLNNYLPLSGGTVTGKIQLNSTLWADNTSAYASSALEIREVGLAGNSVTDLGSAPKIGFHWGGVVGGAIAMNSDGSFHIMSTTLGNQRILDASCFTLDGNTLILNWL